MMLIEGVEEERSGCASRRGEVTLEGAAVVKEPRRIQVEGVSGGEGSCS